ncbi:MAG TPA: VIT1/CCC1 transporter family protein [Jiangellaceae bacterium]|jgi:VIT1/CCC1 family predicted Fe2+/Mn2+ transporter|nr:VIT1/CCC1 transporter family protein [Jiangellaceae bacterium]
MTHGTARVGHEHADVTGGWLRPAVFGAMDGLVSNFALIAGVAGGGVDQSVIILAGLAGLAAGAFSMAAGEYTSVATQAELAEAEISLEREELRTNPDAEERELADMYVAKGLEPELAKEVARQLHLDPDRALDVHTREELGVTLGDLPSPRLAAASSFVAFAVGALVPVMPYLLGAQTLWPAVVVSLLGLFLTGAAVTRLTSRPWWYGGIRQLVLGSTAAALTYAFGNLVGAGLG